MENIFQDVRKPGRYINSEWNSIHKEWRDSTLKIVLAFPDIYEIGMSHLGVKILYSILNQEEDVLCERVFAPWLDMEKRIREEKASLLSLESKRRLKEFNIIGFSLQYEMNYVDILNILDLGGIPLFSKERCEDAPLVIAGGPCAFNPEPMADFIDAFVIGEAEEAILEIVRISRHSLLGTRYSRDRLLEELSKIRGIYVPALQIEDRKTKVKKRIINDLDNSYFPDNMIVPYIQIVHDRIGIEIMRGCPHRCKFCQACNIFHPLRMRSVKRVLEIAEVLVRNTGYEEISLLSLSTGDYPYLEELVGMLEQRFKNKGIKISLPSLRVRELGSSKTHALVKKSGLTFAPEAGSDVLRKSLEKAMFNEDIIQKSNLALMSGWKKVKLYFMIGLPHETYEDLDAIIELASHIRSVSLSISSFIPKHHSAFEREGMDGLDMLKDKIEYVRTKRKEHNRIKNLKIDFHSTEMSRIEAVLSRGDREIGRVIYKIWQKGARLQAWTEYFDYNLWLESFDECGIEPNSCLKKKDKGERLPWDFIEA